MRKRKLRIAQVAPLIERVPPEKYGGVERIIYYLTEELITRGHDVTVFASGDSQTGAKLKSVYPTSLTKVKIENPDEEIFWTMLNIANAYEHSDEFDIIHDHNKIITLPFAQVSRTPVVLTLHYRLGLDNLDIYQRLNKPYLVSLSKAQGKVASALNHVGTVYNGLPLERQPSSEANDGYLLYVGRISKEKGVRYAVEVARKLNLPLKMAGKQLDKRYFNHFIKPHLSNKIQWLGEIDEKQRNELMSKALCLLLPAVWPEPFGLVMIEAMAAGCPVIGFDNGAVAEIVNHGSTGYVVKNVDEMCEAVKKIPQIDRKVCRQYALNNFSLVKMADGYENIYYKILGE